MILIDSIDERTEARQVNCDLITIVALLFAFPLKRCRTWQFVRQQTLSYFDRLFIKSWLRFVSDLAARSPERCWYGCTSAGGIPATSEQHGLSLLSAHISTFESVRQVLFSCANTFEGGGGNHGLVPV